MNCHYLSLQMFNFIKGPQRLVYVSNTLISKSQQLENMVRPLSLFVYNSSQNSLYGAIQNNGFLVSTKNNQSKLYISRNKYKSAKAENRKNVNNYSSDDEDELEDEDEDDDDDLNNKNVKTYKLQSMRLDLLLKSFLKISRKNVENSFYENKIRLNGQVVLKKSLNVKEGDEIDLIIGFDNQSSNCLNIKRVVILKAKYDEESNRFHVKGECFTCLKVKNYSGRDMWREAEE